LLASDLPAARETVDLFVCRIGRELGSLAAALGGLDARAFTAGIGEHAPEIRRQVCQVATLLGLTFDDEANLSGGHRISRPADSASA
jgi:acetate kinase